MWTLMSVPDKIHATQMLHAITHQAVINANAIPATIILERIVSTWMNVPHNIHATQAQLASTCVGVLAA